MRRRIFQFAVVLSLLLCLVSAALWARSFTRVHAFQLRRGVRLEKNRYREHQITATFSEGRLWIAVRREDSNLDYPRDLFTTAAQETRFRAANAIGGFHALHASQKLLEPRRRGIMPKPRPFEVHGAHDISRARDTIWGTVLFPAWLLPLVFAILPAFALSRYLRTRRRIRHHLCTTCGYDLRASSDRCPECGSIISAPESPQSLVRPVDAVADQ